MASKHGRIFCTADARQIARKRLPKLVFDFIDGATGREVGASRNTTRFDDICLQSRIMTDISGRGVKTSLLEKDYNLPFGVAPMGMCNLVHPHADAALAKAASKFGMPVCISSAASTNLEDMFAMSDGNVWFQLYFGQSEEVSMAVVDRASNAGLDILVLTVDVPVVSRRVRDLRNGFNMPFRLTARSFFDFASHPAWTVKTLMNGLPTPKNMDVAGTHSRFHRNASRDGADWNFLERLRERWKGKLIVKGVTSPEDAIKVQQAGADAIYVSNHGARQLDSSPAAIDLLAPIRAAIQPELPLIFDSGVRSGEDIAKALALGADFVMLGRPALYALGAEGGSGLNALIECFVRDLDVVMAQLGVNSIDEFGTGNLHSVQSTGNGTGDGSPAADLCIAVGE